MKIESASINMNSVSREKTVFQITEDLRAWGEIPTDSNHSGKQSSHAISEKFKAADTAGPMTVTVQDGTSLITKADELKIRLLNMIMERITGKKLRFQVPKQLQPLASTTYSLTDSAPPAVQGWGIDYQKREYYSESESLSFQSGGIVKTSDGREIKFNINLYMSRSFESMNFTSLKAGDAMTDPLVINFGKSSAGLTQSKFSFDLDNDGKNDSISFADTGSGFLAYDRNNDGIINNGSELFGPGTGNGFIELAQFDSDGNNWIDENDPIYDKLRIWTKDENGKDQLFAIGQKGIGAIYLGSVDSTYSLKDTGNRTLGQISRTGVFLREDGTAGTIQHLDISL